jgi:hypothetical protein
MAIVPIVMAMKVTGSSLAQAAHVAAHVLLVVHAVDDRAGAQEQQRLEEGVGEQVEHAGLIGADAQPRRTCSPAANRSSRRSRA